ncbi:MAG: diacylglycerol kinase family lipid kinase [Firmicutes bacterium]|nr:diacylglycerol kinase family lipid kinase [Bacillota bacterium]
MLYIIVNENSRSGKGAEIWKEVKEYLEKNNVGYIAYKTEREGHAMEIAGEICAVTGDKEFKLVAIGGDGTINETLNGITAFDRVRFGVIPTGSGNDFARGIGITGTPVEQMERILAATGYKPMDLGRLTWKGCEKPRLFGVSAGAGLDAIVCKEILTSKLKSVLNKLHLGKLTYIIMTVKTLFTMDTVEAKVSFDGARERIYSKKIFVAGMNFKTEGGGVPMTPAADAADGLLSFCMAYGIPKWRTFFVLPFLALGKHQGFKGVKITNCRFSEFKFSKPVVLHTDGEYLGESDEVIFECVPGILKIMN